MAGLQGCILPIVGEAEQLPEIAGTEVARMLRKHLAQDRERENRCGRGAAFAGEARQAIDIPAVGLVQRAAFETETEFPRNEPVLAPEPFHSGGIDAHRIRDGPPVTLLHHRLLFGEIQPGIR